MKKNLKIFLKFAIALLLSFSIFMSIHGGGKTHADSGYDTSYSSDSSSSYSSSDYGSSSYSSSDYGSSSYSSSGDASVGDVLGAFFIVIILIVIITIYSNKKSVENVSDTLTSNLNAVNKLKELIPGFDEKEFLKNGYQIYVDVQNAWTNFELDKVQNIITDELFNQYESQLSSMEIKGEQNIMKDFVLKSSAITNCNKQNDNIEVQTKYIVEFYDYIVNKESGKVLRGNSKRKVKMYYNLTFVRSASQTKIENCPNCGAKVDITSAGTCAYCGSKIVGENSNWVLSKKLSTRQVNL